MAFLYQIITSLVYFITPSGCRYTRPDGTSFYTRG